MPTYNILPDRYGDIRFTGEDANGIVCPAVVNGNVWFAHIKSAIGLMLPEHVGGGLILNSLSSTEGLTLPKYVGSYLDLANVINTTGLAFPEYIGGPIWLNNRPNTKLIFLPKTFKTFIYGDVFAKIGRTIFSFTQAGSKRKLRIPMLRSKKSLGAWLERVKSVDMPKWLLIWFLTRRFSEEQANNLADTILAGKMLTS
jgi:hypothetical protein